MSLYCAGLNQQSHKDGNSDCILHDIVHLAQSQLIKSLAGNDIQMRCGRGEKIRKAQERSGDKKVFQRNSIQMRLRHAATGISRSSLPQCCNRKNAKNIESNLAPCTQACGTAADAASDIPIIPTTSALATLLRALASTTLASGADSKSLSY